jgi:hypothetical protein
MKKTAVIIILLFAFAFSYAQTESEKGLEAITMESIKSQLGFLASDWTEGRGVGTKGAYMAADYIASMMQLYGVEPFGDEVYSRPSRREMMAGMRPTTSKSYYQNFSLLQYEPGEEQRFSVVTSSPGSESAVDFVYHSDFSVNTGTVGQSAQAGLVFAGYAFTDEDGGYDDLAKIDIKGKIAVVLRGYPGHQDSSSLGFEKFTPEGRYAVYRLEREKMNRLADAGAIAVIQITPGVNPSMNWSQNQIYPVKGAYYEADQPLSSYYNNRMAMPGKEIGGNIPAFTVTPRVANAIISGTDVDFEAFEAAVANDLKPQSQVLDGKSVAFKTTVNSEVVKARNVVGMIEGEKKDEFIVVGGHYDHLGKHDGWIWNGADDNASGTVGVLSIARAFKATGKKPERSIIFAAWTGEEKGLYGSKYFVEQAGENDMNVVLNLNYDMIARDTERDSLKNMARMVYTEANYNIEETTKKFVDNYDINLDLTYSPSEKPGGGSDHAPFANAGIPVFYYMAAMHPDYHQPSDELSKINWDKMLNIIKIGFLSTWEFANTDEWTRTKVQPEEN